MTKAQVVDGEFVMKEEVAFQEKEQEAEKNAEAKAAKAKEKARNDAVVVGKRKGKAAAVAGVSSKNTKQKGKEVPATPLPAFLHILTIYIDALCGRPDRRGQGEVSKWCHVDNSITHPQRRGLRPRKARLDCGGGGGDQDWESEDN